MSAYNFIAGIQLTSLLDYPGEISSILFLSGCNLRCGYCHNADIVRKIDGFDTDSYYVNQLINRKHIIDHVVISGGEPSIHGMRTISLLERLKYNEFKIKLDTNGFLPTFIDYVIEYDLVDYIAMDIKTILDQEEYSKVTRVPKSDVSIVNLMKSIELIIDSGINHEFRTTVIKTYHTPDILLRIASMKLDNLYFQQFIHHDNIFDPKLEPYSDEEFKEMITNIMKTNPRVHMRGI